MSNVLNNANDFERLINKCRQNGMKDFSDEMILELSQAFKNSPNLSLNDIAFRTNIGLTKQELIDYAKKIGIEIK